MSGDVWKTLALAANNKVKRLKMLLKKTTARARAAEAKLDKVNILLEEIEAKLDSQPLMNRRMFLKRIKEALS